MQPPDPLDPAARRRLGRWLSEALGRPVPGDGDVLPVDIPRGGGWSNDTWIVSTGLDDPARVVVRVQPERLSMFPRYDLGRQVSVLAALGTRPDVPAPALLAVDLEGRQLGRPAFVMSFVAGRVPADDRPSFAEAGWLREATASDQRRFHRGLLEAVAAVHATPLDSDGLAGLRPPGSPPPLAAAIDDLAAIWAFDRGPVFPAALDDALVVVRAAAPAETAAPCLLWGDARPANVVCHPERFEIVALLDWELAGIGPPELDLAWLAEMNWVRIDGAGLPPLPGFLDDDAALDCYEAASGRRLRRLPWFRTFAALRVAVLMHRYLRAMVHAGRLPRDHPVLAENVSTRRLRQLLGAAGESTSGSPPRKEEPCEPGA